MKVRKKSARREFFFEREEMLQEIGRRCKELLEWMDAAAAAFVEIFSRSDRSITRGLYYKHVSGSSCSTEQW